jgi:two-component system sensor histidine kinase CreC
MGDASCTVNGAVSLIGKAFDQLLDNAVRASPAGAIVDVSWRHAGGQVEIRVRDAGAGIPASVVARVGTLFLQADQSLTRGWEGAGLGLAFVHRVALLHGGALRFEHPAAGGTCAVLALPRG